MYELTKIAWYIADKVIMDIFLAEENNYPVTREFIWKNMNFYSSVLPAFGLEELKVTEKEAIEEYICDQLKDEVLREAWRCE